MPDFQMPDVKGLQAALDNTPLDVVSSDKGQFFTSTWWPKHHAEVEKPVLEAIAREDDPTFDRRVNVMRAAEKADKSNGSELEKRGFTASEITRYVTRAMNKRLKQIAGGSDMCFVIRNQKLSQQALEHKKPE